MPCTALQSQQKSLDTSAVKQFMVIDEEVGTHEWSSLGHSLFLLLHFPPPAKFDYYFFSSLGAAGGSPILVATFSYGEDNKDGNGLELDDNGEDKEATNEVASATDDSLANMLGNHSIGKLFEDFVDQIEWGGPDYHHNHDSEENWGDDDVVEGII